MEESKTKVEMKETFYDTIKNLCWEEVTESIYSKTESDAIRALAKNRLDIEDFKALISPAAEKFLEQMAQMSRSITQRRFGKVMQFYIPMYLSTNAAIIAFIAASITTIT